MRILVPRSDSYSLVRLIAFTPKGEVNVTVSSAHHRWVDLVLPPGVQEDEVDVYSCFLRENQLPPYGCGPALLRAATRKPDAASAVDATPPAEVVADAAPAADAVAEAAPATPPPAEVVADAVPAADAVAEAAPAALSAAEVATPLSEIA